MKFLRLSFSSITATSRTFVHKKEFSYFWLLFIEGISPFSTSSKMQIDLTSRPEHNDLFYSYTCDIIRSKYDINNFAVQIEKELDD